MEIKLLGTRQQKGNKTGNKSCVSDILGNREGQNKKNKKIGNKGTQGKCCWEHGTPLPEGPHCST